MDEIRETLTFHAATLWVTDNSGVRRREEMAQCRPTYTNDPGPRFEQCIQDATALVRTAADEWAKGDPEEPPVSDVLEAVLRVFEKQKFLRRPF